MTIPMESPEPGPRSSRQVDARPLWSGGVATAVVAALIALVGILVARWLFHLSFLSPRRAGAWGDASTGGYVLEARATDKTGYTQTSALAPPEPNGATGYPMVSVPVR